MNMEDEWEGSSNALLFQNMPPGIEKNHEENQTRISQHEAIPYTATFTNEGSLDYQRRRKISERYDH
jgi:hypothetical protein